MTKILVSDIGALVFIANKHKHKKKLELEEAARGGAGHGGAGRGGVMGGSDTRCEETRAST
jgi:hypothetical protein